MSPGPGAEIRMEINVDIPRPRGRTTIIEHTEAMKVIDVNSGRYAAKREQDVITSYSIHYTKLYDCSSWRRWEPPTKPRW